MTDPDEIRLLRHGLGLTQDEFATRYRIPISALRQWEQRRRKPSFIAGVMLSLIARHPHEIAQWLS